MLQIICITQYLTVCQLICTYIKNKNYFNSIIFHTFDKILVRGYSLGIHEWLECCEREDEDEPCPTIVTAESGITEEISPEPSGPTASQTMRSMSFVSMNIWFIACNLRHVFFISSVNAWLTGLDGANCSFVSKWTNYFGFFQLSGLLCELRA